jgi:excisionase family DNA binding protein
VEGTLDQHAIAALLAVTTRTLRTWIQNGEMLEPRRIGRTQIWFKEEVEAWLKQRPSDAGKPSKSASAKPIVRRGRPRLPV